ncbi:MAG: hypothetical protein AAFO69_10660, partial [Bacteroidota bacterium]
CIADLSYRTSLGIPNIMAGYKGGKLLDIDLPVPSVALPNRPVTVKDLRKVLLDMPHPDKPGKLLIRNVSPTIATTSEVPFYVVSQENSESFLSYTDQFTFGLRKAFSGEMLTSGSSNDNSDPTSAQRLPDGNLYDMPIFDESEKSPYDNVERIELNGLYNLQIDFEENLELPEESYLRDLNQNYFTQEVTAGGQQYRLRILLPYWDEIRWTLKDVNLATASLSYRERSGQQDYFLAVDKLNYDDHFYDYYAELNLDQHLVTAFIRQDTTTPLRSAITINGIAYDFSVKFIDWNELSNGVNRDYQLATRHAVANANVGDHLMTNVSIGAENIFDIRSDYEFPKGTGTRKITLLTRITFGDNIEDFPTDQQVFAEFAAQSKVTDLINQQIALEDVIYTQMLQPTADFYQHYLDKLQTIFRLLYQQHDGIWYYLGQHRNLCEDFSQLSASRVQEIALFGKLTVSPGINISQVLGEIYFKVDQFLHPLVKFHTLSEMTAEGHTFDELFNGPLLHHGFIADEDLLNLKRKSVIYTSDLIRLIMDVEGVEAIEDFNISSYIDNRLLGRNVINCLNLTNPDVYKPKLSYDKSALTVCVNGQMIPVDKETTEVFYQEWLRQQRLSQLPDVGHSPMPLPVGRDMEIEAYYSVQHDFPETYGIGHYGLPLDADDKRQSQAKQLKAYLMPFEQLLANYLKQIAHLPELFSFNRSIDSTYADQPLYDIPDVAPLFQEISSHGKTWDAFRQDLDNSYRVAVRTGESEEDFRNRRNRFLSHQLARFGEQFHEYAVQLFDLHKDLLNTPQGITQYQQERTAILNRLIDDKISFAEDYELVSSHRYGAFNTTIAPVANTQEIGAYKLRLCRLLGLKTATYPLIFGQGSNGEDLEGMQVVEHILLRPRNEDAQLMTLTNRQDEDGNSFLYQSDKDPYSFRVTVVLPKEAGRFQHQSFRDYTERLIRMETPAHILVDIKWMSSACGSQFEVSYLEWKSQIHQMLPYFFSGSNMWIKAED